MPGNRTDYGTEQTDRAVKRVERRLSSVYRQAQRDIDDKLKDWQERHKKRDARYRQMVAAGEMSKEDYRAWLRGQVFQEKQWQARRDEIDNILLNADRAAQNIVNEGKLGVFAANANYMGYTLERDSNIDTGFVLYSEGTVARLIEDDPQILPKPAPGVKKELAFPYYNKLMTSAITQGIVQGETISEIAGRVARTTGESSYKSAMRNARTAYTGAQNAGRIEGLHQAQRLGIKVKKKWLAILDSRTRDTHKDLDGQTQEVDDPFVVDGDEIMFPGDPTAKPALTYNCRCTLTYEYHDYPSTMPRRDAENGQIVADMTYREWEESKREQAAVSKIPSRKNTNIYGREISIDDRLTGETREILETLIDEYDTRLEKVEVGHDPGQFVAGSVDIAGATMEISQRKPETVIHEFAHSLANSKADKYGLTHDGDFWKEIRKIKREYKKDVGRAYNRERIISSYEHGASGPRAIDEFLAEAFAHAKMREMGIPIPDLYGKDFTYSQRVLDIVDKYFRRGKHV